MIYRLKFVDVLDDGAHEQTADIQPENLTFALLYLVTHNFQPTRIASAFSWECDSDLDWEWAGDQS